MGTEVIGYVNIDVFGGEDRISIDELKELVGEDIDLVVSTDMKGGIYYAGFEMTSSKRNLDYSILDGIKRYLLGKKVKFTMSSLEFVKSDEVGYYYSNRGDDK